MELSDFNQNCHSNPEEAVVICGISASLPKSQNLEEFRNNLFNKVELIDNEPLRWEHVHPEIPRFSGKLRNLDKFDAEFFGIPKSHVNQMDPQLRVLLEKTYECVLDAGLSMNEIRGSRTGVFTSTAYAETQDYWFSEEPVGKSNVVPGTMRSLIGGYLSHFFNLQGPAINADAACSGSFHALHLAYEALQKGTCDFAIVNAANVCLTPKIFLEFSRLGAMSSGYGCRSFDNSRDGYSRSDTVVSIFLQKLSTAKRVYAKLVHLKLSSDGFKDQGITHPGKYDHIKLYQQIYDEANIDVRDISFVEAHGTGTKAGDMQELSGIDAVFCQNRKTPLYIGSVKSNMGHSEPASGLVSLIKVILGMESGMIPPNLHYETPMENFSCLLQDGAIKVVTEAIPWPCGNILVGINNFGIGGSNGHAILEWNQIKQTLNGSDNLCRLVCVSGRTTEGVRLDNLSRRAFNIELIKLVHDIFRFDIRYHKSRGFSLISGDGEVFREISNFKNTEKDFECLFGDVIVNISATLYGLTRFQDVANTLKRLDDIFSKNKLHGPNIYNKQYNDIIGTIKFHLIIIKLMKQLQLKPGRIFGYSIGEISCGYFTEALTIEQTLMVAHHVAIAKSTNNPYILLPHLKEVITESTVKNKTWISVDDNIQNCSNKLIEIPVYFADAIFKQPPKHLPLTKINSIALNIEYLEKVDFKFDDRVDFEVTSDPVQAIFLLIGRLYNLGLNCDISALYPNVKYPVSRGTPMISPFIKWDHTNSWFVCSVKSKVNRPKNIFRVVIDISYDYWKFLSGHFIDGKILFPMTGYIHLALSGYATMTQRVFHDLKVVMKNIKALKMTTLRENESTPLTVSISRASGYFEIFDAECIVATGEIHEIDEGDYIEDYPEITDSGNILVLKKDAVYKEYRLRGYNYRNEFTGIQEYKPSVSKLLWQNNWITFLDCFMQVKYLNQNSRSLVVPTLIDKLLIDTRDFYKAGKIADGDTVSVYFCSELDTVKTEHIQMQGIHSTTISRRRIDDVPLLESYEFVAHEGERPIDEAMRINAQIIFENSSTIKFRAVEIYEGSVDLILSNYLDDAVHDIPKALSDLSVHSNMSIPGLRENIRLEKVLSKNLLLLMGHHILEHKHKLIDFKTRILPEGFLISVEDTATVDVANMALISRFKIGDQYLLLLKNISNIYDTSKMFELSDKPNWLAELQNALVENPRLTIYSNEISDTGVLGFVNCLRKEPETKLIRCLYVMDSVNIPKLTMNEQLAKDLKINVYKDGRWGTYRHLLLQSDRKILKDNVQLSTRCAGDFSNLCWIESAMESNVCGRSGGNLIEVHYAALNFRDILVMSGRLSPENVLQGSSNKEYIAGLDFAGLDENGQRVMGMVETASCSNRIVADPNLLWKIPPNWSMEEAATIPVVYSTVLYAFMRIRKMRRGDSILIHAGAGGVGLSAINICLVLKLDIFVTVGTVEKKEYILKEFPEIKPVRIGHSRDISFEQMVKRETKGRGVDCVFNSLAGELQIASIRCLAKGGTYVEIGKADLISNSSFHMELLDEQTNFHGIMLDYIFRKDSNLKILIRDVIQNYIDNGFVKPLDYKTFTMGEVESAFRFMASGKHIGKILIRMKENIADNMYPCKPKFYCDGDGVYIVIGGLGGFGMELVDWLILRGAKKVVLTSRSGVTTEYQNYRIRFWKNYGVVVIIRNETCATEEGCRKLLEEIKRHGNIVGIFNLAVVLRDALFANLTNKDNDISFSPKIKATAHLDKLSREHCPHLKYFVVFSSVSCGRGNAAQTNYGMGNSYMERLCERRKKEGLPALAIQWGAIGDVGLVAERTRNYDAAIAGTTEQRISSCLDVMEIFMRQDKPIVASIVIARNVIGKSTDSLMQRIAHIIGLQKINSVSKHSTFPSLGMDSIMVEEIKQMLDIEYDIALTAQALRSMTFAKLQDLSENSLPKTKMEEKESSFIDKVVDSILRYANDDGANTIVYKHKTLITDDVPVGNVIILTGIEGSSERFINLAANLKKHAYAYHNLVLRNNEENVKDIAENALKHLRSTICGKTFSIIAYSFGVLVALEMAAILEKQGLLGKLAFIDASPELIKKLHLYTFPSQTTESYENLLVTTFMSKLISTNYFTKLENQLMNCSCFEDRLAIADQFLPVDASLSAIQLREMLISTMQKINFGNEYEYSPSFKLNSSVKLYRTKIERISDLPDDYGLSEYTTRPVSADRYDGDHSSILSNTQMINDVAAFME